MSSIVRFSFLTRALSRTTLSITDNHVNLELEVHLHLGEILVNLRSHSNSSI